jgi:hypothetical protein
MSTTTDIINQTFREANYVALGETPLAAEVAEALPRLQNLISSLMGTTIGEQLREWYAPVRVAPRAPLRIPLTPSGSAAATSVVWAYPPANSRIVAKVTEDATLYFPAEPDDGARMGFVNVGSTGTITLDGNGRLIDGAATLSPPVSGSVWFYRADLGDWKLLAKPAIDADMPLPEEFDDLFVCGLAIRLASRYGVKQIDAGIIERYKEMMSVVKKHYTQSQKMPSSEWGGQPSDIRTGIT